MIAEACILSLDRAIERRPQVDRTIATCPLSCSVISAVDGNLLSDFEIGQVYKRKLHSPTYIAELRKAEIGCFLSHRKAWQKIATGSADAVLVLEDDIHKAHAKHRIAAHSAHARRTLQRPHQWVGDLFFQ